MMENYDGYMVVEGPYYDGNWTTINEKCTLAALHVSDQEHG